MIGFFASWQDEPASDALTGNSDADAMQATWAPTRASHFKARAGNAVITESKRVIPSCPLW